MYPCRLALDLSYTVALPVLIYTWVGWSLVNLRQGSAQPKPPQLWLWPVSNPQPLVHEPRTVSQCHWGLVYTIECLKQLHWLTIKQLIQYKILVITHKSLNGNAPKYIQELVKEKQTPSRSLILGSSGRIFIHPKIWKETFASRSFSYAALALRNSLPRCLLDESYTTVFKKHLKKYFI